MKTKQETTPLAEGTPVRYWDNGWRFAYFERYEPPKRAQFAILLPPMLGKRRVKVRLANVEPMKP